MRGFLLVTYFLSAELLLQTACSIFRPKITRSQFSSMFGLCIPYPAGAADNSQIHLWLENAVWPILERGLHLELSCRSLIWRVNILSSLSRGIFVDSHNRRVERERVRVAPRERFRDKECDREKTTNCRRDFETGGRMRGARHGPGLMIRDLRVLRALYHRIFFVIEFLPYSARLIAPGPHQSFINWPSHKKFSLVSIINNAI